jgi:hypothetical protein
MPDPVRQLPFRADRMTLSPPRPPRQSLPKSNHPAPTLVLLALSMLICVTGFLVCGFDWSAPYALRHHA